MAIRIIPAIMSGGGGTRLWPLSTNDRPKQFHALGGVQGSLLAETARRAAGAHGGLVFLDPLILCSARHAELIRAQLAGAAHPTVVLEPLPRNTAAAGAVAAALAAEIDHEALVLLMPADHLIADPAAFHEAIERAAPFARERIVTFGITPDRPATGYGYIRRGKALGDGVFAVDSFREKPDAATAQAYLAEGAYSWNAGIFLFHPAVLLAEFAASAAIRDAALGALAAARRDGDEVHLDALLFAAAPSEPLDTAVMEKTTRAAVVPCSMGWADIGAWDEIWRLSSHDANGNVAQGPVAVSDVSGSLLYADGVKLCISGVHDLIVVATGDAVLILPRDRAQDVKHLRNLAEKL